MSRKVKKSPHIALKVYFILLLLLVTGGIIIAIDAQIAFDSASGTEKAIAAYRGSALLVVFSLLFLVIGTANIIIYALLKNKHYNTRWENILTVSAIASLIAVLAVALTIFLMFL